MSPKIPLETYRKLTEAIKNFDGLYLDRLRNDKPVPDFVDPLVAELLSKL